MPYGPATGLKARVIPRSAAKARDFAPATEENHHDKAAKIIREPGLASLWARSAGAQR